MDVAEKVGLGPDQWLKMWETDFADDPSCEHTDPADGEHHHSDAQEGAHEDHGQCNDTVDDVDDSGKPLKVDKYLIKNISRLTGGNTKADILVSLCGDTKDLQWLSSKGYSVVGVELSEKAVKQSFENACGGPIPYEVTSYSDVKVYSATDGKSLRVYVGDFFGDGISPRQLGKFDSVWDSHGIVSLPISMQKGFADKLLTFVKPGGKMLFSTVDYDITTLKKGPAPAPIPCALLKEFYPNCKIDLLENLEFEKGHFFDGVEHVTNPITLVEVPK